MTVKKFFFIFFGFLALGLGAIGIALPVLPTTPFVLLAAICFGRSSERFYRWLQRNRVFGPFIENYRTKQGIKKSLKVVSICFLWAGLIASMIAVDLVAVRVMLACVGVGVTIHLLRIKTKQVS